MELYLDSADLKEIETVFERFPFLTGLTTTPTFMYNQGVNNIDELVGELSKKVPILQIEAMGDTAEEILTEAERYIKLGLDPAKTVFKIPVSLEGVRACYLLRKKGMHVNVHLVYTLQQAFMAMQAGATYVCPLVGRLQDQGHDALDLMEQCVSAVEYYGYDTKIMFSSVRNNEHVRNAINLGVHAITVPWKILRTLTDNAFTTVGTEQFIEHTRLLTRRVREFMRPVNPLVNEETILTDAIVKMTEFGFGCITVVDKNNTVRGVFTDGDLRRLITSNGREVLSKKLSDLKYKKPISVEADAILNEASLVFINNKVDTILVMDKGKPAGMLDIQDMKY
jgi:TalC/MipB family fructose-6-phosphate aldolase